MAGDPPMKRRLLPKPPVTYGTDAQTQPHVLRVRHALDHRDREETGMNGTETCEICFVCDILSRGKPTPAVAPVSRSTVMDGRLLMW